MEPQFVSTPKALEETADRLRKAGVFAMDTEFMREGKYRPHLCLLQIAAADFAAVVDPFEVPNLEPFVVLLRDPEVEVVLHAGMQDMQIFFDGTGKAPRRIFDTQIAAAFAGYGDKVGFGALVKQILGVDLTKTETFTDWSRRPLSPEQMEYAVDDVLHLLPMRDALVQELREAGREAWAAEDLARYEDASYYRTDFHNLYLNVGGLERLARKDLAVLRELAAWREQEAQRLNRPRQHIVHDVALVEIARRAPETLDALRGMRGVHPQLALRSGEEILRRVRKGRKLPQEQWPPDLPRPAREAHEALVVDLLETYLRVRAPDLKIGAGCIASRKDLAELVRAALSGDLAGADLPLLKGWRRELVGNDLLEFLQGRATLGFDPPSRRVVIDRPKDKME
jgi:ribonuclease D